MFTQECGPEYPFQFHRLTEPEKAHLNPQLHPIVRHYQNGAVVATHHVLEEMAGFRNGPQFAQALIPFLENRMGVSMTLSET